MKNYYGNVQIKLLVYIHSAVSQAELTFSDVVHVYSVVTMAIEPIVTYA